MKSLILAALLCAALISRSQEILFTDSTKISPIATSIITESPGYHLIRIDTSQSKKSLSFIYSDGSNTLSIEFAIMKMGGNKDLELPDTVYYKLAAIKGPYKALFPYWKKYFQPDADLIEVQANGHGKVVIQPYKGKKYFVCAFNKSRSWWITFDMH
jgi:hypothetical protein